MDEVITALFSFGRSYYDVPLGEAVTLSTLEQLFEWNRAATCAGIAQTISVQSVHPPLFFCWLHSWLGWVAPIEQSWVWKLRALPAIAGVVSIGVMYTLNRIAFSKTAGVFAALVMAVSPFAVYLSQEARHYTVPMVMIAIALLGLIQIQQDLHKQQIRPAIWIGWSIVNGIGFYVHYFFVLAVIAQVVTLIGLYGWQCQRGVGSRRHGRTLVLSIALLALFYLPGLPTFLSHIGRSETDWLKASHTGILAAIAPLYQLVAGWLVMAIALPVENQPLGIAISAGVLMLLFGGWLGWRIIAGLRWLWLDPKTHWQTVMLMGFVTCVVVEFLAIVYGLNKDITQVPRYNFIYFPAVCALVGASLWAKNTKAPKIDKRLASLSSVIVFVVGVLSCGFVVYNLVFLKPYEPSNVAQTMNAPGRSLVIMAYKDFQDIALGLSFALALPPEETFAFVSRLQGYNALWQSLSALNPQQPPHHVWMIAPGLRQTDFPAMLSTGGKLCRLNTANYHRIGIPYQGYDCDK
ncbi:hypothetical protein GS601_01685 [Myxacorys almedinensis A]|uniref:Glycosyltransferase RgtA/B/C/D-like domain-containing protein n=2 Tax=Myxacorys TaxID=2056239 RepID=A0A8J8CLE4_9CYAN|nr:glycosyltransferase family 39 protein [Myxacorys almedinensis]NDJ16007.1 hypothetical protein [Myxacorys almedinensis A]